MGRRYHTVGCDGAPIDPTPLDYRLTKHGWILARLRCERGHLLPQIVAPTLPPDDPELKRIYLSGAAVGYSMARYSVGTQLAQMLRRLLDRLPVTYTMRGVGELVGMSVSHLHYIKRGDRPKRPTGIHRAAADAIQEFKND